MRKIYKKLFMLLMLPLCLSLFACTFTGGVSYFTSNQTNPIIQYRLINDDTAYEVVGINSDHIGYFFIDISFDSPDNDLGELPVLGIADNAFENHNGIVVILIAANILYIGENAFKNWLEYQTIFFQISEKQSTNLFYEFDEDWKNDCMATINWGTNPEQFGISLSDYQLPPEINESAKAQYKLINNNTAYMLTDISLSYDGFYNVPRVYKSSSNEYGELPVISIDEYAFSNSNAEYICIPNTIKSIGIYAFAATNENQKILFQIEEEETSQYDFAIGWDNECFATIYWGLGDLFIF